MVAKRQAQKVDTQETAQNRRGTARVNENPKVPWKFEDEALKGLEGWTMQRNRSGVKKVLCSRRHALYLNPKREAVPQKPKKSKKWHGRTEEAAQETYSKHQP